MRRTLSSYAHAEAASSSCLLVPVSEPIGASWDDLRHAVEERWTQTQSCAKWMALEIETELFVNAAGLRTGSPFSKDFLSYAVAHYPALADDELRVLAERVLYQRDAHGLGVLSGIPGQIPAYDHPLVCPIPPSRWTLAAGANGWTITLRLRDRRWILALDRVRASRVTNRLRVMRGAKAQRGLAGIWERDAKRGKSRPDGSGSEIVVRLSSIAPGENAATGILLSRAG